MIFSRNKEGKTLHAAPLLWKLPEILIFVYFLEPRKSIRYLWKMILASESTINENMLFCGHLNKNTLLLKVFKRLKYWSCAFQIFYHTAPPMCIQNLVCAPKYTMTVKNKMRKAIIQKKLEPMWIKKFYLFC